MTAIKNMFRDKRYNENAVAPLRRVAQRKISAYEIASYAVLPCILVMAGAMPSFALFLMPIILPMLYLLYRRFGIYFPLMCVVCYGALSLAFNYDILTVIYFISLVFALFGLVLSAQFKPYLLCAAIALIFSVTGAFVGAGVVRAVEGKPLGDVAYDYVIRESDDPFIDHLIKSDFEPNDSDPEDPSELERVMIESYADNVREDISLYAWYYCVHFGGVFAAAGYLLSVIINRRTSSCYDFDATETELRLSTRCLGGVRIENTPIADMRTPRSFLWTFLLPALIASLLLDVFNYNALASTIMHAFITIPAGLSLFELLVFFAALFRGKGRIAAFIIVAIIGAVMVYIPIVFFFASIFGVCDVIINLRYWTHFIADR